MKFLSLIILFTIAGSAFAQERREGRVTLRDGRAIMRIDVGNDRDDRDERDNSKRIRRLEQAVSELQDQVYNLQAAPAPREKVVTCTATFFSIQRSITETSSNRGAAKEKVLAKCESLTNRAFCTPESIRCFEE